MIAAYSFASLDTINYLVRSSAGLVGSSVPCVACPVHGCGIEERKGPLMIRVRKHGVEEGRRKRIFRGANFRHAHARPLQGDMREIEADELAGQFGRANG